VSHVRDSVRRPAALSPSTFSCLVVARILYRAFDFRAFRATVSTRTIVTAAVVDKELSPFVSLRDSGYRETRSDRLSYIDHVRGKSRGMRPGCAIEKSCRSRVRHPRNRSLCDFRVLNSARVCVCVRPLRVVTANIVLHIYIYMQGEPF